MVDTVNNKNDRRNDKRENENDRRIVTVDTVKNKRRNKYARR